MFRPRSPVPMLDCLPFILTFGFVFSLSLFKLFPWLSGGEWAKSIHKAHDHLPTHNLSSKPKSTVASRWRLRLGWPSLRGMTGLVFAASMGLDAVFVVTIIASITDKLEPAGRSAALRVATPSILCFLVVIAPALELHTFLSAAGWSKGRYRRLAWVVELAGVALWLCGFWWISGLLLTAYSNQDVGKFEENPVKGCLARVAIIGISNMAIFAAFGACSALWQKFGVKAKTLTENDIARKKAGLTATEDMLFAKENRLANLQRKLSETLPHGFMARVVGTLRNNPDQNESNVLQLEISGLQTMRTELSNELLAMETRYAAQVSSRTLLGRIESFWQFIFCVYCVYRICSTASKVIRQLVLPNGTVASVSADPVTQTVTLIATNFDPKLDREAWSALLSVLLSILMLLASLNGALQTFLTITRLFPNLLLTTVRANLPLLVGQVVGTYCISSALMVRTHIPKEVGTIVTEALGAPLDVFDIERWFEWWFLGACIVTFCAIYVGKKFRGEDLEDSDDMAVKAC